MLTPEELVYANDVLELYQDLDVELSAESIKMLEEIGDISNKTPSEIKKIEKKYGLDTYLLALTMLAVLNRKRATGLKKTFTQNIKNIVGDYNKQYDKNIKVDNGYIKDLNKAIKTTNKDLQSLNKSISIQQQKFVTEVFKEMYKGIGTGQETYDKAFKKAVKSIAENNVSFKDKNGNKRSIESTVRQEIRYKMHQNAGNVFDRISKIIGATGVQVSITGNCRPSHQVINGERFTLKEWQEYAHLRDDYNCGHEISPIIYEIEDNIYTQEEIYEVNNRTVNYKGKQIPYYEATQKQRALERNIRNAKKTIVSLEKAGQDTKEAKAYLSKQQANMRKYLKETGLERQYDREFYSGYNK